MKRLVLIPLVLLSLLASAGCMTHAVRVEPISLEPVQVTMDVNLHVDDTRPEATEAASTAPAPDAASSAATRTSGGDAAAIR